MAVITKLHGRALAWGTTLTLSTTQIGLLLAHTHLPMPLSCIFGRLLCVFGGFYGSFCARGCTVLVWHCVGRVCISRISIAFPVGLCCFCCTSDAFGGADRANARAQHTRMHSARGPPATAARRLTWNYGSVWTAKSVHTKQTGATTPVRSVLFRKIQCSARQLR